MTPLFMLVTTAWLAGADVPAEVVPQAESSSQSGIVTSSGWKEVPESEWHEEGSTQTDSGWKEVPVGNISEAGWKEVPGSQTDSGWKEVPAGKHIDSGWQEEESESHHPILDRLRSLFSWGSKHENSSGVSETSYKTTGTWVETTGSPSSGTRIKPVPTTPSSVGPAAGNFYDPEMQTAEPPK